MSKKKHKKKIQESAIETSEKMLSKEGSEQSIKAVEHKIKKKKKKFGLLNWRKITVRVLISSFALGVTVIILPGVTVIENRIYVFVILAIAFGIANTLLKPVIEFFTFALAFVTMGISIMLINGILLLILDWIFPELIQIDGLISALLAGIMIGIIITLLETAFGVTPPIEDDLPKAKHAKTYSKVIQTKNDKTSL